MAEMLWTVSQLAARVKAVVAQGFPQRVRVIGEISNFSDRTHWFFSLKDEGATIRCVCFASAARRVSFGVSDGMAVIATGRLDYYDAAGQLQLYVDRLEPVGVGELELRFRQLCEELRSKGYFAESRKKPLPAVPQAVAVVTSRSGAALQDVVKTARNRWAGCRLVLVDVRVQGPSAAPQIAAAINYLSREAADLGIQAIILTRGGGSMEDLWAFNERVVAEAVYRCQLPLVAAIGHETDTTIAELVADVRCSTPTQAAMRVVPDATALREQLDQWGRRLALLTARVVEQARQRLAASAGRPMFRRPRQMAESHRHRLHDFARRLTAGLPHRVATARLNLEAVARQLEAVGPMNVLRRGYSYTKGPNGTVLRSALVVHEGDLIETVLAEGSLRSRIENKGQVSSKRRTGRSSNGGRRTAFTASSAQDSLF